MLTDIIPKVISLDELMSQEFLDEVSNSVARRIFRAQVFSKTGFLPEEFITSLFDNMERRSIEGRLKENPSRFMAFHMDEQVVNSTTSIDFYKTFMKRIEELVSKVPEYRKNPEVIQMITLLKKDFRNFYGSGYHDESSNQFLEPVMKDYHNFGANLRDFLENYFMNDKLPRLIPIFNFQWPEALNGEEEQRAIDALKSYAHKIKHRYDHNKREIVTDTHGELTSYEKEIARKNGKLVGFVSSQLIVAGGFPQIIAAPLYSYKSISHDPNGTSWAQTIFANDVMLDEFMYRDFERI